MSAARATFGATRSGRGSRSPWQRHGTELIPAREFKAPIPVQFQDEPKFMVFRYDGKLPMAGIRVHDVFHVLWIEPEFNRLYTTAQAEAAADPCTVSPAGWPGFPVCWPR